MEIEYEKPMTSKAQAAASEKHGNEAEHGVKVVSTVA